MGSGSLAPSACSRSRSAAVRQLRGVGAGHLLEAPLDDAGQRGTGARLQPDRQPLQPRAARDVALRSGHGREVVEQERHRGHVPRGLEQPQPVAQQRAGELDLAQLEPRRAQLVERPRFLGPLPEAAVEDERLLERLGRGRVVVGEVVEDANAPQRVGGPAVVAQLAVERQRLVDDRPPGESLVDIERHVHREAEREVVERVRDLRAVALGPPQRERLLVVRPGAREVPLPVRDAAEHLVGPRAEGRRGRGEPRARDELRDPGPGIGEVAALLPEPPDGGDDPQRDLGVAVGVAPM